MGKKDAADLARHMHEKAGASFSGLKHGESPSAKNPEHKAELTRVKAALDSFGEQQHQASLKRADERLAKRKPKPMTKTEQEYHDRQKLKNEIEDEETAWSEGTKVAERESKDAILTILHGDSGSGLVMRTGIDGMKHVYDMNRTVPKGDSKWERENPSVASGRTWREVLEKMPKHEGVAGGSLHSRVAHAMGWSEKEVASVSAQSLRDNLRHVDPKLAEEIGEAIRSGSYIRQKSVYFGRIG